MRKTNIQCPDSGQVVTIGYFFGRLHALPDEDQAIEDGLPIFPETYAWCKRLHGKRAYTIKEAEHMLLDAGCEQDDLDRMYW